MREGDMITVVVAGKCDLRDHGSDHRGGVSVPADTAVSVRENQLALIVALECRDRPVADNRIFDG